MKDNQQIYRYVEGEMTKKQRSTFETRLSKEPALRKALEMYRDLDIFSDIKSNASLQTTFNKLGDEHFVGAQKPAKVINLKKAFAAAAAVLLLVYGIWWLMDPPHIRLYKQVAHAELSIATKNTSGVDVQKMEAFYNSGDYKNATPLLQQYLRKQPEALNVQIALGISLMENNRFDLAAKQFGSIQQGNSAYKWEATFYLALLNLKQGNMEDYHKYLDEIPESSPVYKRVRKLKN